MSKAGKTRSADTPQVLLEHHLKALRLPTFLGEYEKQARECAAAGVDHARYLLRLAELELIERERRLVDRRIRAAKFPAASPLGQWRAASSVRISPWCPRPRPPQTGRPAG